MLEVFYSASAQTWSKSHADTYKQRGVFVSDTMDPLFRDLSDGWSHEGSLRENQKDKLVSLGRNLGAIYTVLHGLCAYLLLVHFYCSTLGTIAHPEV